MLFDNWAFNDCINPIQIVPSPFHSSLLSPHSFPLLVSHSVVVYAIDIPRSPLHSNSSLTVFSSTVIFQCLSIVHSSNTTSPDASSNTTVTWIVIVGVLIAAIIVCTLIDNILSSTVIHSAAICYFLCKHVPCFGVLNSIKDQSKSEQ